MCVWVWVWVWVCGITLVNQVDGSDNDYSLFPYNKLTIFTQLSSSVAQVRSYYLLVKTDNCDLLHTHKGIDVIYMIQTLNMMSHHHIISHCFYN